MRESCCGDSRADGTDPRTGRSAEYERGLLRRLWGLLQEATSAADDQIVLGIQERPPSQALVRGRSRNDTRSVFQAFAHLLKKSSFKGFQVAPGREVRRNPERELAVAGVKPKGATSLPEFNSSIASICGTTATPSPRAAA